MATSPNLLMDLQVTGTNAGTWGTITNDNLSIIDNRFGGRQAKSVASSNITLSDAEAENVFQRITGTLGANIDYIFPASAGGFYLISNEATGSFDITVKPSGGTGVTVPQGAMTLVFINPSQTTALKINVISAAAANTFTALQTFSAGVAITGAASPTSNDAAALGTGTVSWSDLYLASGGVVNWANGDVTITHSSNQLAFFGASSGGYAFDSAVRATSNDGAALGTSTVNWSDLFLASGGVVNWNNGDVTITHSANTLAFAGASSGYTFTGGPVVPATNDAAALGTTSLMWSDLFLASDGVINWNNGAAKITCLALNSALAFDDGSYYAFDSEIRLSDTAGGLGTSYVTIKPGSIPVFNIRPTTDTASTLLNFRNAANTQVGSISQNGSVTSYNTTSDQRLKTNVVPLSDSGEIIDRLAPVYFTWQKSGQKDFGFIAQQVADIPQVGHSVVRGNDLSMDDPNFSAWSMQRGALEAVVVAELKSLRGRLSAIERG